MPKDQKKTGRQNYDWAKIQHEYVTDPEMSLRRIAKKHGINYQTVAKRSKAEGWFATRKKHQSKVISKAISRTGDLQAKELADEASFLKLMKGHVDRMLSDNQQFQRQTYIDPLTGELKEKVTNKFDSRAVKDTMQCLKMIEEMSRSLYNIQKATEIQSHQLAADKANLERERFEFEKEKANFNKPDSSAVIRIEGYEEGWDE